MESREPNVAHSDHPVHETSLAQAQLHAAGLRVTAVRIAVLAALLSARNALTHLELLSRLPGTDRVTLYRTLESLIEAGLAHKIPGSDRAVLFGAGTTSNTPHATAHQHGHFQCTGCGKVFCLGHSDEKSALLLQLQKTLKQSLEPGFRSHDIELTIKGWCAECARHETP